MFQTLFLISVKMYWVFHILSKAILQLKCPIICIIENGNIAIYIYICIIIDIDNNQSRYIVNGVWYFTILHIKFHVELQNYIWSK